MDQDYVYNSGNLQVYTGERRRVLAVLDQRPELKEEGVRVFDSRVCVTIPVAEYLILDGEEKKRKVATLIRGLAMYAGRHDEDETEIYTEQVIEVINEVLGDI